METKIIPLELKETNPDGSFKGYGAIFGNLDDGGDVIAAGAFKKFKKTKDGQIRIMQDHEKLLGKASVEQDDKGLRVIGQINMDLSYAADTYTLMKDGSMDALSVGFNILPKGSTLEEDDSAPFGYVRTITKAELWEVSVVPFGMNPKARIQAVKAAVACDDIREFEFNLRQLGYSRREAKAISSGGFKALQRDAAMVDSATLDDIKATIAAFKL